MRSDKNFGNFFIRKFLNGVIVFAKYFEFRNMRVNQFGHKRSQHRLDMGGDKRPPHKKTEKTRDFEKKH